MTDTQWATFLKRHLSVTNVGGKRGGRGEETDCFTTFPLAGWTAEHSSATFPHVRPYPGLPELSSKALPEAEEEDPSHSVVYL